MIIIYVITVITLLNFNNVRSVLWRSRGAFHTFQSRTEVKKNHVAQGMNKFLVRGRHGDSLL